MFGEHFQLNEATLGIVEQIGKHMPGGFFIYKAEQPEELLYVNHTVLDIFGCDDLDEFKELTGYTFKGMVHPDDYVQITDSINDQIALSDDDLDYVEYRIIRKDGEARWVDDFGHFTHTEAYGGIYYVFISDITEKRVKAETDKAMRIAVIEALSEAYDAVWLIQDLELGTFSLYRGDSGGETIHSAPINAALQQLRYPQAKDGYIDTVVAPSDRQRLRAELSLEKIRERLSDKPRFFINYQRLMADGTSRYYRIEFARVKMPGGNMGVVCGFKDVDDEIREEQMIQAALEEKIALQDKLLEQSKDLREALQAAEEANNAKSNFLSNMSHEIRTPITAILGMNELIRRESSDKTILDYAENIDKAGNSLLAIINDILDFSKIEAGKMDLVNEAYSIRELLSGAVNLTKFRAEEKGILFKADIDPRLPVGLYGDDLRIKQILTNLLSNAFKYTEQGTVTLTARLEKRGTDEADIYISVKDTGIGVREEEKEKLFSAFDRLDVKRTRSIEGTGLGLAITSQMLTMMGSRLSVTSEYGKGSDFFFTITQKVSDWSETGAFDPMVQGASEEDTADGGNTVFVASGARILIVDDTPLNLKVIVGLLKHTGVQTVTASSGKECIEAFGSEAFDMVFLDYRMPQMDGIETLKRLKELYPKKAAATPIISLTASAVMGDRERMLSAGFTDYLSKPVNIEKMEAMMLKYLPEDKVRRVETDEASDDDELRKLPPSLFDIESIDPAQGLEYCGDAEDYIEALQIYEASIDKKAGDIERILSEGDTAAYINMVHSLKSTSKAIGAMEISELALNLEKAGREGDEALIKERTPALLERYRELGRWLRSVITGA